MTSDVTAVVVDSPSQVISPTPELLTYERLAGKIQARAELSVEEMDQLRVMTRVKIGDVVWETMSPPPGQLSAAYLIHAMFIGKQTDDMEDHMEGDVRVYCQPSKLVAPDGKPIPHICLTVRAKLQTVLIETMGLEGFIREVSGEWVALAVLAGVIEGEDDEDDDDDPEETTVICKSCGAEVENDASFCGKCGKPVISTSQS